MTRNGKIARLPATIREELNRRFQDGETASHLVSWINNLPEVEAVFRTQFAADGGPTG